MLWVVTQFAMLVWGGEEQVSWPAHVGGIIAGAVLIVIFKRRSVPLFDRAIVSPRAVVADKPRTGDPAKQNRSSGGDRLRPFNRLKFHMRRDGALTFTSAHNYGPAQLQTPECRFFHLNVGIRQAGAIIEAVKSAFRLYERESP